jgi:hypothetical protein
LRCKRSGTDWLDKEKAAAPTRRKNVCVILLTETLTCSEERSFRSPDG